MKATSPRWHEVTKSEFPHEERALAYVRELLPDRAPWAAWSNFTFVARDGRHREVDLLVATPSGMHLIEIKNWHGHLTNEGQHWSRGGRPEKSPLDLTVKKSKELASYLEVEARRVDTRMKVPFVDASIFLAEPLMRCSLSSYQRHHVYAPDEAVNDLPRLGRDLLLAPGARTGPEPKFLDALADLLRRIGISAAAPSRMVGPWRLDQRPYDEGPTWQDFHASRTDIAGNRHRRIRVYLEARLENEDARRSVRSAAEREFNAAAGLHHPGLLAPADLDEHELGPALVIEQDRDAERLDHWLIRHRDELTMPRRVSLVRQLASAVAYAHRKRLVHRALAPRAVIVEPGGALRVGEWQVAARGLSSSASRDRVSPTSLSAGHLDPTVEPYLAPEFSTEGADGTVDLDVFGVGALSYLILTGHAPAETRRELHERLARDGCLDPDTGDPVLDAVVRGTTRPKIEERLPAVDEVVEALQQRARPPQAEMDPLEAKPGDVLPDGYKVEHVLGTGSSAHALLVRRDGLESVLKIGLNAESDHLLWGETAALEDLRHDHVVILRRATFPLGRRHAIELSPAGERTLADAVGEDGPFRGETLRRIGDQLLSAVDYLERRGARHRDLKPANVGLSHDASGEARVALFDFSLGSAADTDLTSGTSGYLDPFLGLQGRETYDAAAEHYAAAATLHELAAGERPRWGNGTTAAAFVDAVTLADGAFDPAMRGALIAFFTRALAKSAEDRFGTAAELRAAWDSIFASPAETVRHPRVLSLHVDVAVVGHLRSLPVEVAENAVDALETACDPTPELTSPVGARDERMRLLRISEELAGVVLVPEGADRGLLLRLMAPGAAAAWARDHTASVNEVSGVLELRDAVALDRLGDQLTQVPTTGVTGPFDGVTDADLAELGIDTRVVAFARGVRAIDALEAAQPILPEEQFGVLLALARGQGVEEVRTGLAPRRPEGPVDTGDLGAAVARTSGKIAMLEDLSQLRDLLDQPISQFRTFLHPSQERLAYKPNWGSVQVSGGPGTGKTVVALHRVKHLVERRDVEPNKILLTTYNKGLTSVLERDLRQMLDARQLAAVQISNIDRWANGLVRSRLGKRLPIVEDEDARWRRAASEAGTSKSAAFLAAEWQHVVQAQAIPDEDAYLACDRRGRGRPLASGQRREVWAAMTSFERSMRADGRWTYGMIADEAARLLVMEEPPFDHVVVDEIQDLQPAHWRLLRAAVKVKPEDLFLTGDPHQRIYGHRVSLRSVGINVGGRRSSKLSLSYRTSAEILQWAMRMRGTNTDVGLDDVTDSLGAYRSSFSGSAPDVVAAETQDEEFDTLVDAVHQWHADGIDWEDIAVVGRSKWVWSSAASALRKGGVPTVDLRKAATEPAVRVGTMHGLKGLEFRAVAVVGVREGVIPRQGITPVSEDELVHRDEMQDEQNLLFVAVTRPRERLRVSWHGAPSPFLPEATVR